jgi:hypothetical protein
MGMIYPETPKSKPPRCIKDWLFKGTTTLRNSPLTNRGYHLYSGEENVQLKFCALSEELTGEVLSTDKVTTIKRHLPPLWRLTGIPL